MLIKSLIPELCHLSAPQSLFWSIKHFFFPFCDRIKKCGHSRISWKQTWLLTSLHRTWTWTSLHSRARVLAYVTEFLPSGAALSLFCIQQLRAAGAAGLPHSSVRPHFAASRAHEIASNSSQEQVRDKIATFTFGQNLWCKRPPHQGRIGHQQTVRNYSKNIYFCFKWHFY